MDRSRTDRYRNQRWGDRKSITEPEYAEVDDQEEVLNVCILPPRPLNEEREYADRDLLRSSSAHSLPSLSAGSSIIPPREIPLTSGPAVNRDLKPSRRKTRLDNTWPSTVQPEGQRSHRCPPSPSPFAVELASHLSGLALHKPCREGQIAAKKAEFSLCNRDLQSAESTHNNQRHSLDLETHDIEKRSQQHLERVPSKRHHHEWPQTKEDFDQHDFVPKEKPQQTTSEDDWYVGSYSRADAEHALHLVNQNGAFLVRDCSINSNSEPLVLAVYHEKKVYNVKIRFLENISKYALGTGQRSIDMFDTVADIIKFHSIFPIVLISGRNTPANKYPENCVLTCPVTRRDVEQLLH